jgi:UDP-N-acetylglucosamine 2-epimerase
MAERTICVVTGARSEYGHLSWLLREIDADPDLEQQLVVTGAHLDEAFGGRASIPICLRWKRASR